MSSFKDTFTRDQRKESLLSYDANASLYFSATILIVALLPWTWNLLKITFFPSEEIHRSHFPPEVIKKGSAVKFCPCSECSSKIDKLKKENISWKNRFTKGFFIQSLIVTILWIAFYAICINIGAETAIHSFDPFEILGVPRGSTDKEIKRAYRAMSLKWHPDKNPNNPQAEHMFMLISKAQLALTDEIAKKNYEKYGNPDGPTSMKIGIGLPPFLVEEDNQIIVLTAFFCLILLVVPLVFISIYHKQKKYANCGAQNESLQLGSALVGKELKVEEFAYVVAASAESRSMKFRPGEDAIVNAISKKLPEISNKKKYSHPLVIRNYFLLMAHLYRLHHLLSDDMLKDLTILLKTEGILMQPMLEGACVRGFMSAACAIIDFRRRSVQAVGFKQSELLQIPHFNPEIIDEVMKGRTGIKSIEDFCQLNDEERKGVDKLTKEQREDVKLFCRHITDFEVYLEAETKGEKEIAVGDFVTFTTHIIRRNLKEDELAGPVHAPYLDIPVFEKFYVFLVDEKESTNPLVAFGAVKGLSRKEECVILTSLKKPGPHSFKVIVMSDAYIGIDKVANVKFTVVKPEETDRKVFIHEEDRDLDKQPTFFEQIAGIQNQGQDSDEEEEVVQG